MNKKEAVVEESISVLNVGAKILLRDVMDQYLRSLGNVRTYYASSMKSALRNFTENRVDVLICEVFLEDGSAERLIESLGPRSVYDDLWIILALHEDSPELRALVGDLQANSVLIKPFSAAHLKGEIEKYKASKTKPVDKSVLLIKDADIALKERRTFDADKKFKEASLSTEKNADVLYQSGVYFLTKPEFPLAEKCLYAALELAPNAVKIVTAVGLLEMRRGNIDKAFEYLSKAHSICPFGANRAINLSRCLLQKSAEMLAHVTENDDTHPDARLQLGKLLVHQKDYVSGLVYLEKATADLKGDAFKEAQTYMAVARKLGSIRE